MNVVVDAIKFATKAHLGQRRKYTGEPYIVHPTEVAKILIDHGYGSLEQLIAAAYLHDTVEDCGVKFEQIADVFGFQVAKIVYWLSDFTDAKHGVRSLRSSLEVEKFRHAPYFAKLVKLADIVSNCKSICEHDPEFAEVYLAEKREIVRAIGETFDEESSLWLAAASITKIKQEEPNE